MKDSTNGQATIAQTCEKVVELYNSGNNCDKAVLLAMQELFHIPPVHYDFSHFYSDKPEGSDRFLCKVLVAGAIAIYLNVLSKGGIDDAPAQPGEKATTDRVVQIFNRFIIDCSGDMGNDPTSFDLFAHDPGLEGVKISNHLRKEYTKRRTALFSGFQAEFPGFNCVDILGFDPFAYADYDEKTQEEIESGEWMKQCVECMQFVICTVKTTE